MTEAEKQMSRTIAFDFDGVIHSNVSGWFAIEAIRDDPVPGIKEAIDNIRASGYTVVVVSSRCIYPEGEAAVRAYLDKHGIIVDGISALKIPALVYIDDCAICFDGDAGSLMEKIENFKTWHGAVLFR